MRQYDMENEQSEQQLMPQHYEWHQAFYTLIQHPRVETFQKLLQDPQAKAQRAYLWMLLPGMLNGITTMLIVAQFMGSSWLTAIVLGSIVGSISGVMRYITTGYLIQRLAVFFGGDKTAYGKFHYIRGIYLPAILLLYLLITLLLGNNNITFSIVFSALLAVEMILTGFALRAVNKTMSWNRIMLTIYIWYFIVLITFTFIRIPYV